MFLTEFLSQKTLASNRRNVPSPERYEAMLPLMELSPGIPGNIFQICLRGPGSSSSMLYAQLPEAFIHNIDSLKSRNPQYHYQLVSDEEAEAFIKTTYGEAILSYYHRIDSHYPAARADLLRYLLLYAKGGVYLDLKSSFDAVLSERLKKEDRFLLFYWDNIAGGQRHCLIPDRIPKGEVLQAFIISAKGHPFLRSVILKVLYNIDNYNPYTDGVGWSGVVRTTGPALYTETIYDATQADGAAGLFREDLPFANFGFKVNFQGDYTPGQYQKQLSLRDYRKCCRPVVRSRNPFSQFINVMWLKILDLYRKGILKAD